MFPVWTGPGLNVTHVLVCTVGPRLPGRIVQVHDSDYVSVYD